MKTPETYLNIESLSIGYGTEKRPQVVLPNLDLSVCKGKLIGLVGSNGSGKSTLLKTLAGLQAPISGKIKIEQKNLSDFSRPALAKLLSFVGTHYDMHSMMRVHQVVSYGRYPYTSILGRLRDDDREIIRKAMYDTGIYHLRDSFIGEISDGEKQRVLIARSLAQDTSIILLDEPTAFLDIKNKFEVLFLLSKLAHQHNKIILFSSHDLQVLLGTVDLIWFIDHKKIIQGLPEELVMNNTINELLRNSKIYFDPEENEFKSDRKYNKQVNLIGSGHIYKWTVRALERCGIKVSEEEQDIKILITHSNNEVSWKIRINNNQHTTKSLQSLMDYITSERTEVK